MVLNIDADYLLLFRKNMEVLRRAKMWSSKEASNHAGLKNIRAVS